MKQRIKNSIAAALLMIGFVAVPVVAAPMAYAQNPLEQACEDPDSSICNDDTNINGVIEIIVNALLFLIGAIAVIMIIVAGFKYATSGGDSGAISSAKNTILYAIIGLVVAFLAYAIVNWVFNVF